MKKIIAITVLLLEMLFAGNVVKQQIEIPMTSHPIMYIFDSKTCPYCEKLKSELNTLPDLKKLAQSFDIYSIPRDDHKIYKIFGKSVSTQELQMSYRVKATPNVVILNHKGEKMFQTPGYIGPKPLAKMMEFTLGVAEGKYQKSEWAKFLYGAKLTTSETAKKKSAHH